MIRALWVFNLLQSATSQARLTGGKHSQIDIKSLEVTLVPFFLYITGVPSTDAQSHCSVELEQ
jgi:hypothetical protein